MIGFRGWRGAVAEDATVETSTGFADCREGAGSAEVRAGLVAWTVVSPGAAALVGSTGAAGVSDAVTAAGEAMAFTACTGAAADVTTTGAVAATEAGTGFTAGRAVVATVEVAAPVEGAGTAEVQVETTSCVGAGCSIHCWIKL